MKTEKHLVNWLLARCALTGHATKIESTTGRGIPDLNFCLAGQEGWIEGKLARGTSVALRPEQFAWCQRRVRAGGRVFVIAAQGRCLFIWRLRLFERDFALISADEVLSWRFGYGKARLLEILRSK